MVNVLLESYDLTAAYLYPTLKEYIHPGDRVAIVAFSFLPSQAGCLEEWEGLFGKEGMFYGWLVEPFAAFGVPEENITFLNYYADTPESAAEKIRGADILYFTGGLPDAMMDRIREFGLYELIRDHPGVKLGCSAGAVIQLEEYHLSPDRDYPEFAYYEGFPWLRDFYVEVHYEGYPTQKEAIARVLRERGKIVYSTGNNRSAIIADEEKIILLGDAKCYTDPGQIEK